MSSEISLVQNENYDGRRLHERDARAYIVSLNFKRISFVDSNPRLS
jgi:hypothetical protein